MNYFLTVGDLKKLINDIPDDCFVTVVSSETDIHISKVSSVGLLESEHEEKPALGLCCEKHSIEDETDYTSKVLFKAEFLNLDERYKNDE